MAQRPVFTIYRGFAVSLLVHSALGMPFAVLALLPPPSAPTNLVIELKGIVADSQTEQKDRQETKSETRSEEPPAAQPAALPSPPPPAEPPAKIAAVEPAAFPEPTPPSPPLPALKPSQLIAEKTPPVAGSNNVAGTEERQIAHTIKADPETETERLNNYVRLLAKKIQTNLVYPDDARQGRLQGTATVSFTILPGGGIALDSLRVTASSGQPQLDASALKTVRSSLPFDPPPKQITVAIGVAFGPQP
jgi:periplasmic protein TonB